MTPSFMKEFHATLDNAFSNEPIETKAAVLKELATAINDCLRYEHLIVVCNDRAGDEVDGGTHILYGFKRCTDTARVIGKMRMSGHATLQYNEY